MALPSWNDKQGVWKGGDSRTLYAFTDKKTGRGVIRPGKDFEGIGPECEVRVATREEAEAGWQSPLRSGWKIDDKHSQPRTRRNPHMKLRWFDANQSWAFTWGKHEPLRLANASTLFFPDEQEALDEAARHGLKVLENGDVVRDSGEEHVPLDVDSRYAKGTRSNPISHLAGKTLRAGDSSIMVVRGYSERAPYSVVLVRGDEAMSWDYATREEARAEAERMLAQLNAPR